jgi:hypothetical protein
MGVGELIAGTQTYLVGVEDGPHGSLKVYFDHRSRGLYALIFDEAVKADVRDAWAGVRQVLMPTPPPECLFLDSDGEPELDKEQTPGG